MTSVTELYTDSEHSNGHTASSFEIEHGVPLPVKAPKLPKEKKGHVSKYPFRDMQPNDSVLLHGVGSKKANSALQYARKFVPDSKWTIRTVEGGARVWRLS